MSYGLKKLCAPISTFWNHDRSLRAASFVPQITSSDASFVQLHSYLRSYPLLTLTIIIPGVIYLLGYTRKILAIVLVSLYMSQTLVQPKNVLSMTLVKLDFSK